MEEAIFAAGCFWGVEASFWRMPGVTLAESGYTGGKRENPTYEQVCTGGTGHAEAVRVVFDPSVVTYDALVRNFFRIHDPTQVDRQGPDVGTQYRSEIFFTSEEQKGTATAIVGELAGTYEKPIATKITPLTTFWRAEEYHQRYAEKHPGSCHIL